MNTIALNETEQLPVHLYSFDEAEITELNADDLDSVSGAFLPFAIPAAVKIGAAIVGAGAAGAGIGYAAGYWANRD